MCDRCILCGNTSGIEWHHTIQQAYGGVNSEQVPLCGGHHSLVHTLALTLYKTRDEAALMQDIPDDVPPNKRGILLNLVRRLVVGRLTYENAKSNNLVKEKGKVMVTLDQKRLDRVNSLSRQLAPNGGRPLSRERVIQVAIDRLYQSQTAKTKNS